MGGRRPWRGKRRPYSLGALWGGAQSSVLSPQSLAGGGERILLQDCVPVAITGSKPDAPWLYWQTSSISLSIDAIGCLMYLLCGRCERVSGMGIARYGATFIRMYSFSK